MNVKQQRKIFSDELKARMEARGFKGKLSYGDIGFERRYPWGHASFFVHFLKRYEGFGAEATLYIGLNAVEEIAQRGNPRLSSENCKDIPTMGGNIGYLGGDDYMQWTVSSEADIVLVADAMVAMFDEVGMLFIEKYQHLENAFEVFINDDRKKFVHIFCGLEGNRAKQAVVAALLLEKDRAWIRDYIANRIAHLNPPPNPGELTEFKIFLKSLNDPDLLPSDIPEG